MLAFVLVSQENAVLDRVKQGNIIGFEEFPYFLHQINVTFESFVQNETSLPNFSRKFTTISLTKIQALELPIAEVAKILSEFPAVAKLLYETSEEQMIKLLRRRTVIKNKSELLNSAQEGQQESSPRWGSKLAEDEAKQASISISEACSSEHQEITQDLRNFQTLLRAHGEQTSRSCQHHVKEPNQSGEIEPPLVKRLTFAPKKSQFSQSGHLKQQSSRTPSSESNSAFREDNNVEVKVDLLDERAQSVRINLSKHKKDSTMSLPKSEAFK